MRDIFRLRLRDATPPVSIDAWRDRAIRALPWPAWTYVEGGADDLVTVRENIASFRRWRLRTRTLNGLTDADLRTRVAGTEIAMPVALAPTGAAGASHWTGDVAIARAAEAAGTRSIYSSAGSYTPEEVAEAAEQDHWFQLYALGDRDQVARLIDRAAAAGYSALFVTVDVAAMGNREGERRWSFRVPWTLTPARALHMAGRARWTWQALRHRRLAAVNFIDEVEARGGPLAAVTNAARSSETLRRELLGSDLSWDDLAWIRDRWKGNFYVKGLLDPEDAARAVDRIGVQGVVVSNHGDRQLDRCLASIDALGPVVDRVGDRAEVFLDGGIRRGTDVVTAMALGARAVFIGRPYLYGLAAAGEAGVRAVLSIFREEIHRTLMLMGCPSVAALDRSWLIPAPGARGGGCLH